MEKDKPKKRKDDAKDDQQNEEKESSLLKLKVQKKIPIKNNENIFLINNDILIVFKKENKNKKETSELYEIYDGESYQKISNFTNPYKSSQISNIINLFSKEPNIFSFATIVEKEKKNILIFSFEIKDKKYQYKENQLIEIDFIPQLIELNDTSFLVLNKEKREIYIYQKKNSKYEKRNEIIKIPKELEIENLQSYFINKNNFILTDLKPDQDSEEDATTFPLYIYNLNDFKFIRKENIQLSDDNCTYIEKVVICNYNDMNLFLAYNNNIALYNYKDKEIKHLTEEDDENIQIAFGLQFQNNILRIYGGNLMENKICLYDFKVNKDSIEFYSQSENIFDDLLLDEIDGQELGNIACDYFNKDLFSKNILVYDKDNLYVLSEKEIAKVKKSGSKKKAKSKSKNK
jgi:hypothetical protein